MAFYNLQCMVCTKTIHREAEKNVNSWFIKQNSTKQTPSFVDEMSAEHGENQPKESLPKIYYRLNVENGEVVGLDEWQKMGRLKNLRTTTWPMKIKLPQSVLW
jgi:hypothetical protein